MEEKRRGRGEKGVLLLLLLLIIFFQILVADSKGKGRCIKYDLSSVSVV
jgi:hypothetical protein